MNEKNSEDEIVIIAEEIRGYLEKHPNSIDTLDGVANWWLLRQRYESAVEKVKIALEYLINIGVLEKVERYGNKTLYKRPS